MGKGLQLGSDLYDTYLDGIEFGEDAAIYNGAVRAGSMIINQKIGDGIDKMNSDLVGKELQKIGASTLVDGIKEEVTIKEKND